MKKILFICNDVVGPKMAGPAIRCVELAKALSKEFDVVLAGKKIVEDYKLPVRFLELTEANILSESINVEIVIFQGDTLTRFPKLLEMNCVLIADMYCPIPLEFHLSSASMSNNVRLSNSWHIARFNQEQFFAADYFICASQRQMDFWMGALTVSGRVNALSMPNLKQSKIDNFLGSVPFGLPDKFPQKNGNRLREAFAIPKNEFVLVWGGGIYEWFDPMTIIQAISRLEKEGIIAHLVFIGVKHPNPSIGSHDRVGESVELARSLGILDRLIHFNFGWVDYSLRHEYLMDADVGVSAHMDNIETRYSFRTRMLDYLWCGLPIIATHGDEFGDLVKTRNLGIATDYEDVDGWYSAIKTIMTDADFYKNCKQSVEQVREEYTWSKVSEGLIKICSTIKVSNDREYARTKAREIGLLGGGVRVPLLTRLRTVYELFGIVGIFKVLARKILIKFK